MDAENVTNSIKSVLLLTELLMKRIDKLEEDMDEPKGTDIKPKKKKRRDTIGLKVLDGGKKSEEQPPFATKPPPA